MNVNEVVSFLKKNGKKIDQAVIDKIEEIMSATIPELRNFQYVGNGKIKTADGIEYMIDVNENGDVEFFNDDESMTLYADNDLDNHKGIELKIGDDYVLISGGFDKELVRHMNFIMYRNLFKNGKTIQDYEKVGKEVPVTIELNTDEIFSRHYGIDSIVPKGMNKFKYLRNVMKKIYNKVNNDNLESQIEDYYLRKYNTSLSFDSKNLLYDVTHCDLDEFNGLTFNSNGSLTNSNGEKYSFDIGTNKDQTPGKCFIAGKNIYYNALFESESKLEIRLQFVSKDDYIIVKYSTIKTHNSINPFFVDNINVEIYSNVAKNGNLSTDLLYGAKADYENSASFSRYATGKINPCFKSGLNIEVNGLLSLKDLYSIGKKCQSEFYNQLYSKHSK